MPRFFFDLYDNAGLLRDDQGSELATVEEARREAVEALLDAMRSRLLQATNETLIIRVRDDCDCELITVNLALICRWSSGLS